MRTSLLLFVVCSILVGYAFGDDTATVRIAGIEIYGNVTTRPEILDLFLSFKVGDELDLQKLSETKTRLWMTQLYDKVDIFPHFREDGAHIFIILKEGVRLGFRYGAVYSTYKYGQPDFWYYPHFNVTLYNFRGRMEDIDVGVSAWTHRSFDFGWSKPFLTTPYYIALGSEIAFYPDEAQPVNFTELNAAATFGRKLTDRTRLSLSAIPLYRYRSVVESAVEGAQPLEHPERDNFYEAFGALNLTTDYRSARFNPQSGWILSNELRTNRLYNGINTPFFQFMSETRLYLPLLFDDMAAMRFVLTLRDTDAGDYHRLAYGSMGTVRGYYEKALGWNFIANSSVLMSIKYYKPILESQSLGIPMVGWVFKGVKEVSYRIDATLIADYARLYEKPLGALTFDDKWQSGTGLGFGVRIMIPEIRQSGCIDWVYGKMDGVEDKKGWEPRLHVYLDFFF